MSNKWLFGLAICTLAMGAFGCDDDDNSACQESPKIIQESKNFDSAVKADVTISDSMDLDTCEKYANNVLNYLKDETKYNAMADALKNYKEGFGGGSFLNVLCSTVNALDVTTALVTMKTDIDAATTCVATLSADESKKSIGDELSGSLGKLTSLEGWTEVAHAAKNEAQNQANQK